MVEKFVSRLKNEHRPRVYEQMMLQKSITRGFEVVVFIEYYYDDQIKKDEKGGALSMHSKQNVHTTF
jgi:hypothetical protein